MVEGAQNAEHRQGTGGALIDFLNWTIKKNEMVESTAVALRTGCQKVLSTESDPDAVDLRTTDIDALVNRFRNRHRLDIKDRTLDQYEQRFRQSVDMYFKWLEGDQTWKPSQRKRQSPGAPSKFSSSRGNGTPLSIASVEATQDVASQRGTRMITYPFPIRAGIQGSITLPEDTSLREAERIAAFVAALAVDSNSDSSQGDGSGGGYR